MSYHRRTIRRPPPLRHTRRVMAMGDDATPVDVQQATLAELKAINARAERVAGEEKFQKWVQIGVTAAIPVFGALWKIIGKALNRGTE